MINKERLMKCYEEMAKNKVSSADGQTKTDYEENIENLLLRKKRQSYKHLSTRRTYIPKGIKGVRPLGYTQLNTLNKSVKMSQ